jgi:hypothetical protein
MKRTYQASCHCRAVRLEADLDLAKGSNKCNCSICTKLRAWFVFAKEHQVRLSAGSEHLTEYTWVAPGKTEPHMRYQFCKECGVSLFAWAHMLEPPHAKFYAVQLATLDDASVEELSAGPVNVFDGRNDHYDRAPTDGRPL